MPLRLLATLMIAWLGVLLTPAGAAAIDYTLSVPLLSLGGTDDLGDALTLRGTLSYDADAMRATGTFTLGDLTEAFSGFSLLLGYDDGTTGVLFDGASDAGGQLYLNVLAGLADQNAVSGIVTYCRSGACNLFSSIGGDTSLADTTPALPGFDPGAGLPGPGVSPVPLPTAVLLFGIALLGLGALGVTAKARRLRRA